MVDYSCRHPIVGKDGMTLTRLLALLLLVVSADAAACSIVGGFPPNDRLSSEFDQVVESRDVIFRGVVRKIGEEAVLIEVTEVFKGSEHLTSEFWYQPRTNCEETYTTTGEERLFFGWMFNGSVQFSIGDGSVPKDSLLYAELLSLLRQPMSPSGTYFISAIVYEGIVFVRLSSKERKQLHQIRSGTSVYQKWAIGWMPDRDTVVLYSSDIGTLAYDVIGDELIRVQPPNQYPDVMRRGEDLYTMKYY